MTFFAHDVDVPHVLHGRDVLVVLVSLIFAIGITLAVALVRNNRGK